MSDEFSSLMASDASAAFAWALAGGALIGLALWLLGARLGRSLLTLFMVGVGAAIGLKVPQWLNVPIEGWTAAIAMALVMGVAAFVMQRLLTAVGLAILSALWCTAIVCALYMPGSEFSLDGIRLENDLRDNAALFWQSLPAEVRRVGPFADGLALAGGLTIGLLWPKVAAYAFWSLAGMSMALAMGVPALAVLRPQLLDLAPSSTNSRIAAAIGLVLFGMLVQWRMAPRRARPAEPAPSAEAPALK